MPFVDVVRTARPLRVSLVVVAVLALPALPAYGCLVGWGKSFTGALSLGYLQPRVAIPTTSRFPAGTVQIVAGSDHTLARQSDGSVYAVGLTFAGALGLGIKEPPIVVEQPTLIPGLSGVTEIADGGLHPMALHGDGTVSVWGSDLFGQLGNGTTAHGQEVYVRPAWSPQPVPGLSGVTRIYDGGGDDAAVLSNGTVKVWGEGPALCVGRQLTESAVPVTAAYRDPRQIAMGGETTLGGHALILNQDGSVSACGDDQYGQAGLGHQTTQLPSPVRVPGLSNIVAVAAGGWHSLALRSDGTVFAFGADSEHQVGGGTVSARCGRGRIWPCVLRPTIVAHGASAIAAGNRSSYAVVAGQVLGWGENRQDEVGSVATKPVVKPTPIPGASRVTGALVAGGSFVLADTGFAPQKSALEVAPGGRSLTVRWRMSATSANWRTQIRPVTKPQSRWGPFNTLPSTARSFVFSGLLPLNRYQVLVSNPDFGSRTLVGTPSLLALPFRVASSSTATTARARASRQRAAATAASVARATGATLATAPAKAHTGGGPIACADARSSSSCGHPPSAARAEGASPPSGAISRELCLIAGEAAPGLCAASVLLETQEITRTAALVTDRPASPATIHRGRN
jgi:alpha-tubulin suppressor-like RCC1 family protein